MNENPYARPEAANDPQPTRTLLSTFVNIGVGIAIVATLAAFILPTFRRGGEAPKRTQCKNNLKQIGLALHNYADVYGAFPPAYTVDVGGTPLHSWRTLILPFLEQQQLYDSIDLSKPWDDPVIRKVGETRILAYQCPSSDAVDSHTSYVAIVGPTTCLQPSTHRPFSEITDGPDNTLMVIEVAASDSFPWMSPRDVDEDYVMKIGPDDELSHVGGFQGLWADGSVRFLSAKAAPEVRRAIMSAAGGDVVGEF